jgi:hypothetical protein
MIDIDAQVIIKGTWLLSPTPYTSYSVRMVRLTRDPYSGGLYWDRIHRMHFDHSTKLKHAFNNLYPNVPYLGCYKASESIFYDERLYLRACDGKLPWRQKVRHVLLWL